MNEPLHKGHCQQGKQCCALGLLALETNQRTGARLELKGLPIPSIISFAVLSGLSHVVCMLQEPSPVVPLPRGPEQTSGHCCGAGRSLLSAHKRCRMVTQGTRT